MLKVIAYSQGREWEYHLPQGGCMKQVNASVCLGMGEIGKKRLKLYQQHIKERGYRSLSAFIVHRLDAELDVNIQPGPRHKVNAIRVA